MLDLDFYYHEIFVSKGMILSFFGHTAFIKTKAIKGNALITRLLSWHNEQGNRFRQEYTVFAILSCYLLGSSCISHVPLTACFNNH